MGGHSEASSTPVAHSCRRRHKKTAALAQRTGDDLDSTRDFSTFLENGRGDGRVLADHERDSFGQRHLVEIERTRVALLGGWQHRGSRERQLGRQDGGHLLNMAEDFRGQRERPASSFVRQGGDARAGTELAQASANLAGEGGLMAQHAAGENEFDWRVGSGQPTGTIRAVLGQEGRGCCQDPPRQGVMLGGGFKDSRGDGRDFVLGGVFRPVN